MYLVKGFGINASTAINTPGVVNFFGEPSTQALTYSKEKGFYKNPTISNVSLLTFLCEEDGEAKALPDPQAHHAVSVIAYIYNKVISTKNTGYLILTLLQELNQEFTGEGSGFVGGLIEFESGYYVPEWIEWRHDASDTTFKIWFIDRVFLNQYDEHILSFAAPFITLDSFFSGGVAVEQMLAAITPNDIVSKIQDIKGTDPETFISLETYDYIDPFNDQRVIPTHWGVLGYGIAANNIDLIKEELIEFILSNSSRSREDWAEILPDLFKRTEFMMIPLWDQYAIEPRITTPGIYSPIASIKDTITLAKTLLVSYSPFHIEENMTLMGFPYKSVAVASIGNATNRNGWVNIAAVYPDFISVTSTSLDFNRMSERTKLWSVMIHELISIADSTTPSSSIPLTISRIERDGILYLSRMFDNIQYLVATRYSIENL